MKDSPAARRLAEEAIRQNNLAIDVDTVVSYVVFARAAGADDDDITRTICRLDAVKQSTDNEHAEEVGLLAHHIPDDALPDSER